MASDGLEHVVLEDGEEEVIDRTLPSAASTEMFADFDPCSAGYLVHRRRVRRAVPRSVHSPYAICESEERTQVSWKGRRARCGLTDALIQIDVYAVLEHAV